MSRIGDKFTVLSGWTIKKFIGVQVVATLVVLFAIWLGSWVGRSEVVETQRASCYRSINSTIDLKLTNADMDALADIVARADGIAMSDRIVLDAISDRSDERIEDLNKRLPPVLDCETAFPDPGPFAAPKNAPRPGAPIDQPQRIVVPDRP